MPKPTVKKRPLARKVTSFVLYLDQVEPVQAIISAAGTGKDAQVFRDLIDEALTARRRKTAEQLVLPDTTEPPMGSFKEDFETMQTLLLRLVEQGEKARQVNRVMVELLQETLAESHAARLKPERVSLEAARRYAYDLAREILLQADRR